MVGNVGREGAWPEGTPKGMSIERPSKAAREAQKAKNRETNMGEMRNLQDELKDLQYDLRAAEEMGDKARIIEIKKQMADTEASLGADGAQLVDHGSSRVIRDRALSTGRAELDALKKKAREEKEVTEEREIAALKAKIREAIDEEPLEPRADEERIVLEPETGDQKAA
jgi:hypothetical protein